MLKKKILFFVSGQVGGAERMTLTIANLIDKEKYNVKIVITDFSNCPLSKFVPADIPVAYLSEKHLRLSCMKKMKKLLVEEKVDYAFASMTFVSLLLLIICKFFTPNIKPIIRGQINPHYWKKHNGWMKFKGFLVEKINRILYPTAYKVIAQTPTMRNGMIKYFGVKPEKCVCLYNPIDKNNIDIKIKEDTPFIRQSNDYIYVAVGRCQPQKGFDLIIKAMRKVVNLNPNSHVYIVGTLNNDEHGRFLINLTKRLELEKNVHFVGFQTNPYKYIKNADCFVLSSRDEGLPNVLIEATYLHKQAIAYSCIPIIEEIIQDGINGILVEPENVEKLADAMVTIQTLNLNVQSKYHPAEDKEFNSIFD